MEGIEYMLLRSIRRKAQLLIADEKEAVEEVLIEKDATKALRLLDKLPFYGSDASSYDKNISDVLDSYEKEAAKYNKKVSNPIVRPVAKILKADKAKEIRRASV